MTINSLVKICVDNTVQFKILHVLFLFIFYFFIQVFLWNYVINYYYPTGDDFAVFTNSFVNSITESIQWITSGYSKYFFVYPEWSEPFTNFMRPVGNFFIWINYKIFGEDYGKYVLLTYLIHAVGVTLVFYLSYIYLEIDFLLSFLASLIMFLSPASFHETPSFAFDGLAAVWVGIGFIFLSKSRWLIATVMFILGLFTKETIIYGPLAGGIVFLLFQYRNQAKVDTLDLLKSLTLILIPYSLWLLCRITFFTGIGGTYVLRSFDAMFVGIIKGLLIWPLGLFDSMQLRPLVMSLMHLENIKWGLIGILILNIFIWILLFILLIINWRNLVYNYNKIIISKWLPLMVFGLGALPLLIGLNLSDRFGYSFYLFIIPLIVALLNYTKSNSIRHILIFICGLYISIGIFSIYREHQSDVVDNYRERKQLASELVSLIKLSQKQRIYLVNDVVGSYGGAWIGKFAQSKSELIVVNQLTTWKIINNSKNPSVRIFRKESGYKIYVDDLPNKSLVFISIHKLLKQNISSENDIIRNNRIKYRFPELNVERYSIIGTPQYDWGSKMEVEIIDLPNMASIIYFDFISKSYKTLNTDFYSILK